jgi:non-heme chloroperoxidase
MQEGATPDSRSKIKVAQQLCKGTNRPMRRCSQAIFSIVVSLVATPAYSQQSASWNDPSSHAVRFVTVEKGVRLEVLDWGGTGKPVVLLAGGGNTAHVFDEFAPKLATDHHVYGITRRGFGASGFSASENPVDRLRDDVLAVFAALKLERPVLVGHSIAGAELTAVAAWQPDRIAGLIYLEAGYPYAFASGDGPSMKEFQISGPPSPRPSGSDLATFSSLQKWNAEIYGFRIPEAEFRQIWDADPSGRPRRPRDFPGSPLFAAIMSSTKTFTRIPAPALVIFASPHVQETWIGESTDPAVQKAGSAYFTAVDASTEKQARAFEAGVPTARVVRLRGAHYIFLSNERETLREMRAFVVSLK